MRRSVDSITPDLPPTTILRMALVQYESKDNAGHRFWMARYAIRIDINRPGIYRWLIPREAARCPPLCV
jgi:hypothetical protein